MNDIANINILNKLYEPLHKYKTALIKKLTNLNFKIEWGYYALHSFRHNNSYVEEYYPIPVITIEGICDIGIDVNWIFIEGKLARRRAIEFNFSLLKDYNFEVYGINDYLTDFYNETLCLNCINDRIKNSKEQEIGVSVYFNKNEPYSTLIDVIKKYKEWGISM